MKIYTIDNKQFELIEEYKEGFDLPEVINRYTDYFDSYDYIVGDWAYGKLRLKGFCEKNNKINNRINSYQNKDNYLKKECAFNCRYFVLKRIYE
jgi:uncharacterized protein YutD